MGLGENWELSFRTVRQSTDKLIFTRSRKGYIPMNASKNDFNHSQLSRRTAMRIAGAGAIVTAAGGVLLPSLLAEDALVGSATTYEDSGYRLYHLDMKDPYRAKAPEGMPRPIWVRVDPLNRRSAKNFVWASKEQVEKINEFRMSEDATLSPLAVKTAADVGDFAVADGKSSELFVLFCPNMQDDTDANSNTCRLHRDAEPDWAPAVPNYKYESINQIVAKWNKTLKGQGVTITAVKAAKPPQGVGHAMLEMGGQIKIEFKGELSDDVLKAIKVHPQAVSISRGKPFTTMFCPGCGMG